MKANIYIDIEAQLTGNILSDPDTGPDSITDAEVESMWLYGIEYTGQAVRAKFGDLHDLIMKDADDGEWFDE